MDRTDKFSIFRQISGNNRITGTKERVKCHVKDPLSSAGNSPTEQRTQYITPNNNFALLEALPGLPQRIKDSMEKQNAREIQTLLDKSSALQTQVDEGKVKLEAMFAQLQEEKFTRVGMELSRCRVSANASSECDDCTGHKNEIQYLKKCINDSKKSTGSPDFIVFEKQLAEQTSIIDGGSKYDELKIVAFQYKKELDDLKKSVARREPVLDVKEEQNLNCSKSSIVSSTNFEPQENQETLKTELETSRKQIRRLKTKLVQTEKKATARYHSCRILLEERGNLLAENARISSELRECRLNATSTAPGVGK